MKKHLLTILASLLVIGSFAQCMVTPYLPTYIMSPSTVGTSYTLNGTGTYPSSKAFYICQGTTVTIQNRAGADTFYVDAGGGLVGFEANQFRVFMKSGSTYNASNSCTAVIYYETGATITNYSCVGFPPCPSMTFDLTHIGSSACTTTGIAAHSNWNGNIFVYPNPAGNEIKVNSYLVSANLNITVYDIVGNKLMEKLDVSNQTNLDITSLPKGIYFLRVMNGSEIVGTEKFVKN